MPNSFVWIGLVVVWIFVLFPMVAGKRSPVRRTGQATLATRVLHRGGMTRPQHGSAAGHAGDPDWQPTEEQERARRREHQEPEAARAEAHMDTDTEHPEHPETADAPADEAVEHAAQASVPAENPGEDEAGQAPPRRRGRGGFDPQADAAASAARYRTRQRAVVSMIAGIIVTGLFALIFTSAFWGATGVLVAVLALYLAYLRRQVRLEQEIRRRRMARLQRSRRQAQADRRTRATVPGGPRRDGVVVLESDDEAPDFEHLPPFTGVAHQEYRRASGE